MRRRDPEVTSRIMSRVRNRDGKAEVSLRKELWKRGLRYRLHVRVSGGEHLPGKPDIVFSAPRVVVFVDGDFWHGRVLRERGPNYLREQFSPRVRGYWVPKITGNVERDKSVTNKLELAGWQVIRVWESEVLACLKPIADKIESEIRRRSQMSHTRL